MMFAEMQLLPKCLEWLQDAFPAVSRQSKARVMDHFECVLRGIRDIRVIRGRLSIAGGEEMEEAVVEAGIVLLAHVAEIFAGESSSSLMPSRRLQERPRSNENRYIWAYFCVRFVNEVVDFLCERAEEVRGIYHGVRELREKLVVSFLWFPLADLSPSQHIFKKQMTLAFEAQASVVDNRTHMS